jgi:hypothetical protein
LWFLCTITSQDPLGGVGTPALVSALVIAVGWLATRYVKVVGERNADKDAMIERLIPSLTHTADVLESVVEEIKEIQADRRSRERGP